MSSYVALPPHTHHGASRPVPTSEALTLISSYLSESKSAAYLHPDCTFTELGPTFASNAATGGLVLNQLRRIEAGLSGTTLGANPDGELLLASATVGSAVAGAQELYNEESSVHIPYKVQDGFVEGADDSKLDSRRNYVIHDENDVEMIDQSIVDGPSEHAVVERENATMTNSAVDEGAVPPSDVVESTPLAELNTRRESGIGSISKEERKQAKKERRKKEKQVRQEAYEKGNLQPKDMSENPLKSGSAPAAPKERDSPLEERDNQAASRTKKRRRKEQNEDNVSRKRQKSVENDLEKDENPKSNNSETLLSTPTTTTTNGSTAYSKSKGKSTTHKFTPDPSSNSADESSRKHKTPKKKEKRAKHARDLDTHVEEDKHLKSNRIATPDATPSPAIVLRDKDGDDGEVAPQATDDERLSKEARKARKRAKKEARSAEKEERAGENGSGDTRKRDKKAKERDSNEARSPVSKDEKKAHKSKDKSKRTKEKRS